MTVDTDQLAPVDWIVVEFPGSQMNGEIAPVLGDLEERGLIRVLDLLFMKKLADGSLEAFEASDLEDSEIGALRRQEADIAMVLSEQDVLDLGETIEPGQLGGRPRLGEHVGSAVRCSRTPRRRSGRGQWTHPRPGPPGSRRSRRRGRRLTCHSQPGAGGRTAAAVGGAVVVAHGVNRRHDRREDRRDDRQDRPTRGPARPLVAGACQADGF